MRREWSSWIKARQWGELEKLAKADPSQDLADTVAELELGFPEKPDRRALRKILFLLAQSGYQPREIHNEMGPAEARNPLSVAFMVSPEPGGDSVITYGREERGRVSWLIAHFTYRDGITRAIEDTTTIDESHVRLVRMRNMAPTPSISAEIPVDVALERLAKGVEVTKKMPPVMAYWRAMLPKQFSKIHPAEELPRDVQASKDLLGLLVNIQPARHWRLELGSLSPALEEFLETHSRTIKDEEFQDPQWWIDFLGSHREQLFTPEVIEDHRTRLLDVAYLMHLKRDDQAFDVLAIADELRDKGSTSAYAEWMASKTLILLFETLRRDDEKKRPR